MLNSLTPDELLTTTRAVRRRLDFDRPVDLDLVKECLQLAVQAPNGGNTQNWNFLLVTDPEKKARIGELYYKGWESYSALFRENIPPDDKPLEAQSHAERLAGSAKYLAKNMHRVPVMLIPCFRGRVERLVRYPAMMQANSYGSLVPAVWSFMLAARARGLGTCYTTLHLFHEEEAARILGIPYEKYTQAALVPVAWAIGDAFRPAGRKPLDNILHINSW
jgi:nitroreductase